MRKKKTEPEFSQCFFMVLYNRIIAQKDASNRICKEILSNVWIQILISADLRSSGQRRVRQQSRK